MNKKIGIIIVIVVIVVGIVLKNNSNNDNNDKNEENLTFEEEFENDKAEFKNAVNRIQFADAEVLGIDVNPYYLAIESYGEDEINDEECMIFKTYVYDEPDILYFFAIGKKSDNLYRQVDGEYVLCEEGSETYSR